MYHWLSFVLATAIVQVLLTEAADGGTLCGKLKQADNLNLTGNRRWYYCKSTGDISDNGCFIDALPQGNGVLTLKRTTYNKDRQKIDVEVFNVSGGNDPPGPNSIQTDVAVSDDGICMVAIKCWKKPSYALLVCSTKEACTVNAHKYKAFLDDAVQKVNGEKGEEEFLTEIKNYYNAENCKEE